MWSFPICVCLKTPSDAFSSLFLLCRGRATNVFANIQSFCSVPGTQMPLMLRQRRMEQLRVLAPFCSESVSFWSRKYFLSELILSLLDCVLVPWFLCWKLNCRRHFPFGVYLKLPFVHRYCVHCGAGSSHLFNVASQGCAGAEGTLPRVGGTVQASLPNGENALGEVWLVSHGWVHSRQEKSMWLNCPLWNPETPAVHNYLCACGLHLFCDPPRQELWVERSLLLLPCHLSFVLLGASGDTTGCGTQPWWHDH